jgi:uncharacterized OsmC-like protein
MPGEVSVVVRPEEGHRFAIAVRDHVVHVDQPNGAGGADTAPTPLELFVASLAGCVAHYARGYLTRHGLSIEGLTVTARGHLATGPARLNTIGLEITLPDDFPEHRRSALLAVASKCTVSNTLEHPPVVRVDATIAPTHNSPRRTRVPADHVPHL